MGKDIVDIVKAITDGQRQHEFEASDQLSLGQLIHQLKGITDQDAGVMFDFCAFRPTTLDSWRGSYDELALGYADEDITVSQLLARCEEAVGRSYQGYKGGDYIMSEHTPVWVSQYGHSSSTAITCVRDKRWVVVIETRHQEY